VREDLVHSEVGDGVAALELEDGVVALELEEDAGRRRKGMMSPFFRFWK